MSEEVKQPLMLEGLDEPMRVTEIKLTPEQAEAMKDLIEFIKDCDVKVIIRDDKNI